MKTTGKPQYGICSNVAWMVGLAWRVRRRVLLICVLTALMEVLYSLAQLYIAPEILGLVEAHAPLTALLGAIAFFTAALLLTQGVQVHLQTYAMFPRVEVRQAIIGMTMVKSADTAYPNTLDADFLRLRSKAGEATESNSAAAEYIWQGLTSLLKNAGGLLVYLGILSGLNGWLLLAITATCAVNFLVARRTGDWVYQHREEEAAYYTRKKYIRDKAESMTLAKDIRIFGLQSWLEELLDAVHDAYLLHRLKVERKWVLAGVTEALLTMARNGIAYGYLISLALSRGLSVSEFVLYFGAVSTFSSWVMGILNDLSRLHQDSLDISCIREFLEYPEPFRFEGGEPVPAQQDYCLELERVSFRYPGAQKDTIHDLSLVIRPGEKLAIVGLNGAGKTTLVKLLCGLFDPTQGRVLLNGRDIRGFDRRAYYELFSAVFQELSLLDVTVAENVAQQARDVDRDRVWQCLELAGLRRKMEQLPQGLDTHVGRDVFLDGVLFSGGETQRLLLARALYKDGPILLLDEPTAALDPIAENDIYQKYNAMTAGKTAVFISHRLASTRFCDRIVFLADGQIAEEGTHESLLARGGAYAQLFEVQSRYYQEGRSFR